MFPSRRSKLPSSHRLLIAAKVAPEHSTTLLCANGLATTREKKQVTTNNPSIGEQDGEEPSLQKTLYLQASFIKSIVGGGALALPAAVASVGGAEAIPASLFLIGIAAAMSAYSFTLIGTVCEQTGATTYVQAWENTVKSQTNLISAVLSVKTALACLAYMMILADSLSSVASVSRVEALIGVTIVALAPLCLMPNLTALAPYSFVGVVGILLTTAFMVLRFWDGTYATPTIHDDGNVWMVDSSTVGLEPVKTLANYDPLSTTTETFVNFDPLSTTTTEAALNLDPLTTTALSDAVVHTDPFALIGMACTLATAFVCHYNGPRIYTELQGSTAVFERLTNSSFAFGAFLMAVIAATGYMTFGSDSAAVILSSYSPNDSLMSLSRLLIIVSLIATFPLPFLGLRDSLQDKWPLQEKKFSLTFGLLFGIALVAASFDDLGLLLKLGGGTVSTAIAYVIPSLMYLKVNPSAPLPKVLCAVAVAIGITGVTTTLWPS